MAFTGRNREWLLGLTVLGAVLLACFYRSLDPALTLFSNDSPLGTLSTESVSVPSAWFGGWLDLNWIGGNFGGSYLSITAILFYLLGPVFFLKLYAPLSLAFLGLAAGFAARRLNLHPAAAVLTVVAAALNGDFLSNACWGLGSRAITCGCALIAVGALAETHGKRSWLWTYIAGAAVGLGIMDGYDVGAIFSLYVAAFGIFMALTRGGPQLKAWVTGGIRVAVVAVVAAVVAAHALVGLIGTQVAGQTAPGAKAESAEQKWDWATQWSLPKIETIRVLISGLYGYRMDSPDGGLYSGSVGRTPGWEQHQQGLPRYSGSGEYAGVFVVIVALWAVFRALRKQQNDFSREEASIIRFFAVTAALSLLFAFGRHAPFYQLIYSLPYFSSIRNPIKFMHPFHFSLLILFAYGVHGLWKRLEQPGAELSASFFAAIKQWWASAKGPDRSWNLGVAALTGASLLGWLLYAGSKPDVIKSLQKGGFDAATATEIARFSIGEFGWYVAFLICSAGLVMGLTSGWFKGRRASIGLAACLIVLSVDLLRASQPWIIYINYKQKYASNPVIEMLSKRSFEQRVSLLPFGGQDQSSMLFQQLYQIEWIQHLFQFYGIHSLDVIQEPREAADNKAFREVFSRTNVMLLPRLWELTNTRYLLGRTGFEQALNEQLDAGKRRFKIATTFDLKPRPGINPNEGLKLEDLRAELAPQGPLAVIEFTGALPRASIFPHWQVETNDTTTLAKLADLQFDPSKTVLLATDTTTATMPKPGQASSDGGTVKCVNYSAKHLIFEADSPTGGILLLNDKYDPSWNAWVNGQPSTVLRCNFIMRGVYVPAGKSKIEMRFEPPVHGFKVTVAGMGLGVLACLGLLAMSRGRSEHDQPTSAK